MPSELTRNSGEEIYSERVQWSFGRLLAWHLLRGTRPGGRIDHAGRKWSNKAFAQATGLTDRTVRYWLQDQHLPADTDTIERVLFGNGDDHYSDWRLELRDAHRLVGSAQVIRPNPPRIVEIEPVRPAMSISQFAIAPRLSIVVLPFINLSIDPEQQYFVDGIVEDLTIDLSRITDMLVISRNTAFTYRNKPVETKQIGRELGVRYVLEGSVRRSGNRVRVTAQLIDAETDAHLWAERFASDTGDVFALQDEITSRIAIALNLELVRTETARPIPNPDALDYILRGRAAANKPPSRDARAEAISLFERALALDPRSVEAQNRLAIALADQALFLVQPPDAVAVNIARTEELISQALAASPSSPLAHYAKGQVLRGRNRYEEAIPEYEMVLASDRNWVNAISILGVCKFFAGSIRELIPAQEKAIRLSPRDPYIGLYYSRIGLAHLLQSRTDEAIARFEQALNANPEPPYVHANLAAAYALRGDSECAAAELAEARMRFGDDRFSSIARLQAIGYYGVPPIRLLFETTFFAGLRKAGVPEE